MKLLIAYSLLVSFFVVLTPREIWHHCEEDHHIHSTNETHLEKDNCFACDFELTTASEGINYLFVFEKTTCYYLDSNKYSSFLPKKFSPFSHRGPPVV